MPLIYSYTSPSVSEIAATDGSTVVDIAVPTTPNGNLKFYAPDSNIPGGVIQVESSNSNSSLILANKGAGAIMLGNEGMFTGGASILTLEAEDSTPVNYLQVTASNAGSSVRVQAVSGSETNVDVEIGGQGSGKTKLSTDAQFKDDSGNYWVTYPKVIPFTFNFPTSFATRCMAVLPFNGVILYATERHETAGVDVGGVYMQLYVDASGSALGSGSAVLSNNSGNGFDLKATASTTQNGTFSATPGVTFSAGQALTVKFAGVTTALANVSVTVYVAMYG